MAEQIDIEPVIGVIEEDLLSAVASLGDMAGNVRKYDAGNAGH